MVPRTRIELVMTGYQPIVIPFNYPGKDWWTAGESNPVLLRARQVCSQVYQQPKIGLDCLPHNLGKRGSVDCIQLITLYPVCKGELNL